MMFINYHEILVLFFSDREPPF